MYLNDAFFIDWAISGAWKYILLKYDNIFGKFCHMALVLNQVMSGRNWKQSWTQTNSKIEWIHHVFITEFWKAALIWKNIHEDLCKWNNIHKTKSIYLCNPHGRSTQQNNCKWMLLWILQQILQKAFDALTGSEMKKSNAWRW